MPISALALNAVAFLTVASIARRLRKRLYSRSFGGDRAGKLIVMPDLVFDSCRYGAPSFSRPHVTQLSSPSIAHGLFGRVFSPARAPIPRFHRGRNTVFD